MRTLLILLLLIVCCQATATSCDAVSRTLTNAQKIAWAPALAKQLKTGSVSVRQSFTVAGWRIVYVETHDSDPPFLFFHGDPLATHYITMWSGSAGSQEEHGIKAWVIQNAPGIPEPLASCFAWQVGPARVL